MGVTIGTPLRFHSALALSPTLGCPTVPEGLTQCVRQLTHFPATQSSEGRFKPLLGTDLLTELASASLDSAQEGGSTQPAGDG